MTVKELIEILKEQPEDAKVVAYDLLDSRSSDVVISCGYTSNSYDEIYPIDKKEEAIQRVEEIVKECDDLGIELLDSEKEIYYCVSFAPYVPEEIKELSDKYDFENPDLLLQSYMSDIDFARASFVSEEELDAYLKEHLSPEVYLRYKEEEDGDEEDDEEE